MAEFMPQGRQPSSGGQRFLLRLANGFRMPTGAVAGPTKARPAQFIARPAQVVRLVAGSLQGLRPAAPMALTWNQYWVPLVRPVTVQLEALPT
jgi:hypothetical protein